VVVEAEFNGTKRTTPRSEWASAGKKQKKNEKKEQKNSKTLKKDLTEPTLLEMPVYPGALRIARHTTGIRLRPSRRGCERNRLIS